MLHTSNQSFQALVAANRKGGRLEPKAEKSSTVQMGLRLPEEDARRADQLAEEDGRTRANFVQRMYMRGLAGYLAERGDSAAAQ
ncbi:hypothetical protein M4R22_10945 [Acidovorax sp. GBBC 3334]|uniref:hypothetical protein n=1 Tax=Acidovorax sp. GBBC 3334 TaxID=2940496 RepID=UPI0023026447|nr:hypothetical protein [Acidovorax sp. GBBC 3334]MDA8455278.1 hypothetical protein [Acidovorax sp. GBBC 3334]